MKILKNYMFNASYLSKEDIISFVHVIQQVQDLFYIRNFRNFLVLKMHFCVWKPLLDENEYFLKFKILFSNYMFYRLVFLRNMHSVGPHLIVSRRYFKEFQIFCILNFKKIFISVVEVHSQRLKIIFHWN